MYWHRLCCHNRPPEDAGIVWSKYPVVEAIEKSLKKQDPKKMSFPAVPVLTLEDMRKQEQNARREEKKTQNELTDADPSCIWYSNPQNLSYAKEYQRRLNSLKSPTSAVVLEVFAGVGSGLIALKRSKIDIRTVISVEHDELANYVRKQNHQENGHNQTADIKFKEILTFEELEDSYGSILNEYGAIDIVLAGPPCSDYSAVNAYREGVRGFQGSYLIKFGILMQKIREHPIQEGTPLYVICENVVISEKDGLAKVEEHLNCTGHRIDSKNFSPCKRDRMYFTTFPPDKYDGDSPDAECSAGSLFYEDEWMHLGEAVGIKTTETRLKANTFMASKGRLNDYPRMAKARKLRNGRFEVQPYSVSDREKMMGFPDGYVEKPLKKLFRKVTSAFVSPDWTLEFLEYEEFSGLPFAYRPKEKEPPFFQLLIGSPRPENQKTQYYFTDNEYAKHLIGNAFSIPVVEFLVRPLKKLFKKRDYDDDYSYPYPWPPHNLGRDEDECRDSFIEV